MTGVGIMDVAEPVTAWVARSAIAPNAHAFGCIVIGYRALSSPASGLLPKERGDGGDDGLDLRGRQFGIHGEREAFGCGMFGDGKITGLITKVLEALLLVQPERVVDFGADAACGEVGAQVIPPRGPDDELVIDMMAIGQFLGKDNAIAGLAAFAGETGFG